MAHIDSIGAGLYSDLSIAVKATPFTQTELAALDTKDEFDPLFATAIPAATGTPADGTFIRIDNIREFPAIGTPPNIVNVPIYGSKTSRQIQGQSDAPSMELTLNFVASDWDRLGTLGKLVGDGNQYVFRFTLMNSEPTGTGATKYASTSAGLGTVKNSVWYFIGKVEALQVTPQLTDANQATLTLAIQSDMYGAFTVAGASGS